MMPAAMWNLVAWIVQVGLLVAVAGGVATLLNAARPGVRLFFWRAVVALCFALPALQGRDVTYRQPLMHVEEKALGVYTSLVGTQLHHESDPLADAAISAPGSSPEPAPGPSSWAFPVLIGIIAGGAAVRLLMLAVGILRLARLRSAGVVATLSDDEDALRYMTCRQAEIRDVDGLQQPATFGLRPPVVLLPHTLRSQEPGVRRAVLSHELLHAQRGDWRWVLVEEVVRAACWFHPALWWAISRVQGAREELVDDWASRITGSRRTYIDALLLFSNWPHSIAAPAFGRSSELFRRIQLIAKEPVMPTRRLVLSSAAAAATLALTILGSAHYFPLAAAQHGYLPARGPQELAAHPVTPENPIPNRIVTVEPEFPEATALERGLVTLKLTIDGRGHVVEVRQIGFSVDTSDPRESLVLMLDPFPGREQALDTLPKPTNALAHLMTGLSVDAAFQWRYEPPRAAPLAFYASVVFSRRFEDRVRISQTSVRPLTTSDQVDQLTVRFGQAAAMAALNASPRTGNDIFGLPSNVPPPAPDAPIAPVTSTATGSRADSSRATTTIVRDVNGEPIALLTQPAQGAAQASLFAPPPPPPPPSPAGNLTSRQDALTVGTDIAAPKKIKDVRPVYPPIAESARIQGAIQLQAAIDESGNVVDVVVLRSIKLLDDAAVEAVRQWKFTPTLLNGVPVPVVMTVAVNFTLN